MESIAGKVAFITGGTKGIGYGIAGSFLNEGISVCLTGRKKETVDSAVKRLSSRAKKDAKVIGVEADVRKYADQKSAISKAITTFGKVDILVANAGVGHFATIDKLTIEQWSECIDTNLTGVFYTLKAGLDQLLKNKGYFFSIASLAGTNFFKGGSAYNASKFGVTGFTQAAMLDLREKGIKTSVIMPGSVATHFNGNTPDEKDRWKIQKEDLGQLLVDLLKMDTRTLPSKVEVRPSFPPHK